MADCSAGFWAATDSADQTATSSASAATPARYGLIGEVRGSVLEMSLPAPVAVAWKSFVDHVNVAELADADYQRFAAVAIAAHAGGVGLDALGDSIIDVATKDGAPDFLAGELTMGLDIALRALTAQVAHGEAEAAAAAERSAAEQARDAALSKLSPEERMALGLAT